MSSKAISSERQNFPLWVDLSVSLKILASESFIQRIQCNSLLRREYKIEIIGRTMEDRISLYVDSNTAIIVIDNVIETIFSDLGFTIDTQYTFQYFSTISH